MPTFCINFSYVGIRWLKRCSLTGPSVNNDLSLRAIRYKFIRLELGVPNSYIKDECGRVNDTNGGLKRLSVILQKINEYNTIELHHSLKMVHTAVPVYGQMNGKSLRKILEMCYRFFLFS